MNVFVTGATGYIGGAVADALLQGGHTVAGLARSAASAARLEALGARVWHGSLEDADVLTAAARAADGVIHLAASSDADMPRQDAAAVRGLLGALSGSGKPLVYTSGIWVYGDTRGAVVDETSPLNPPLIVAWRPAVEDYVRGAARQTIRTVVIRPAMVYGRNGGFMAEFARSAREEGAARYVGDGRNRWTTVDVDDLADLYVRALERASAGSVYVAVHGPSVPVCELAEAASRGAGKEGRTVAWPLDAAREAMGPMADALVMDQQASGRKAEEELGWTPKARPAVEYLEVGCATV